MSGLWRGRLAALGTFCLLASGLAVLGTATSAFACTPGPIVVDGTTVGYENCQGTPGGEDDGDDGDGGGGNIPPEVEQCYEDNPQADLCQGSVPCQVLDPAVLQDEDEAREYNGAAGLPEKPKPDDHLIYIGCFPEGEGQDGTYIWSSQETEAVSVRDRLIAAYGQLDLPTVTPVFNPPTRTLVNLDTWWWAEGGSATAIRGTEALGLVAIADPTSMTVEAAGQVVTCDVVTKRSDECRMVFRRAGDYTATMRISYTVRFELGGAPFAVPGGNDDLLTITTEESVQVPVREVQSIVKGVR